jgi:uncharacterized protein YrrD
VTTSVPDRLVRGRELIGLPVVTMRGDDVAEIRDVVYDPGEAGALVGFTLNKRGFLAGRHPDHLMAANVAGLGRDAVMVEDESALGADAASDAVVESSTERNVLGSAVVTEDGRRLGTVEDVVLLTGRTPRVEGYVLAAEGEERPAAGRSVFVPLPEQIAVSGDALVVPSDVAEFVSDDLAGFGAAVADFRAAHRPGSTAKRAATASAGVEHTAGGRTKAELHEEAARRDIKGRSSMTKADLERALGDAP